MIPTTMTTLAATATTCLTDLPPEIIGQVCDYDGFGPSVLRLWQCGSTLLMHRLQFGCTRLELYDKRMTVDPEDKKHQNTVPKLVHQLRRLTILKIFCPGRNLNAFDCFAVIPTLRTFKLCCHNMWLLIPELSFKHLFPCLTNLSLINVYTMIGKNHVGYIGDYNHRSLPNYLKTLPSSLTKLKTSSLMELRHGHYVGEGYFTMNLDDVSKQLPCNLQHFKQLIDPSARPLKKDMDFVANLPRDLQRLQNVVTFVIVPNALLAFQQLPVSLTNLNVELPRNMSWALYEQCMNVIPLLECLDITTDYKLTFEWCQLWAPISRLQHLKTLNTRISCELEFMDKPSDEWHLPPKLEAWTCYTPLPLESLNLRTLPSTTLCKLILNGLNQASALNLVTALPKLKCLIFVKEWNFEYDSIVSGYDLEMLDRLPKSLTVMRLELAGAACHFASFQHLDCLDVQMDCDTTSLFTFPSSLKTLRIRVDSLNEHAMFNLIKALPSTLTELEIADHDASWTSDVVTCLPPALKKLTMTLRPKENTNWKGVIAALSRSLKSLDVEFRPQAPEDADDLLSLLPPALRVLRICRYSTTSMDVIAKWGQTAGRYLKHLRIRYGLTASVKPSAIDLAPHFPNIRDLQLY